MEAQASTQTTPKAGGRPFGVQATAARAASWSPWKLSIWGWKISTEPFSTPMTRGQEFEGARRRRGGGLGEGGSGGEDGQGDGQAFHGAPGG